MTMKRPAQQPAEMDTQKKLRIARRSMMYVVRTLIWVIMGCILCIAAFLTAERVSNLYILTSEGMALRAECILADGATNDLEEYFTLSFLETDRSHTDTTYDHYTITDYNYDLSIERISVMPWSVTATVTAVERVTLKGTVNDDQLGPGESAEAYPVPEWTPARYKIDFISANGRWYINSMELLEENPASAPIRTPDPNQSPIPAATPTVAPTDAPTSTPG